MQQLWKIGSFYLKMAVLCLKCDCFWLKSGHPGSHQNQPRFSFDWKHIWGTEKQRLLYSMQVTFLQLVMPIQSAYIKSIFKEPCKDDNLQNMSSKIFFFDDNLLL